jgi:hypothetical protein
MAAGPSSLSEQDFTRLFPWFRLGRTIRVAFDGRKLLLAAFGLIVLRAGWDALDWAFAGTPRVTPEAIRPYSVSHSPTLKQLTFDDAPFWVAADPPRVILSPFFHIFAPAADNWSTFHAILAAVWAVLIWSLVGGAIARIAAVEFASGQRLGVGRALRFALTHKYSLIAAPLSPFLTVGFLGALCALPGLLYQSNSPSVLAAAGLLVWLPLLAAFVMALILAGLVLGWPLMIATVVIDGEDGFDALSRSYSYVNQRLGRYAAYLVLAWILGTIGLLLVCLLAHLSVRLTIWGLALGGPDQTIIDLFENRPAHAATLAARLHAGWVALVGLFAYAYAYSFFWSAASMIYLLLRKEVDGKPWDDIFDPNIPGEPFSADHLLASGSAEAATRHS